MSNTPYLEFDTDGLRQSFDREPAPFSHNLAELDLFNISFLHSLAEKMLNHPGDYMVAGGAPEPGTDFFSVPGVDHLPHEAIEKLERGSYRILLKRAENHDKRYKELVNVLVSQLAKANIGFDPVKIVRLESGILISSAATITPFHFDPEIGFFSQIQGEKRYHVYSPSVVAEPELERFYIRQGVSIAQLDLQSRDGSREYVFHLKPGLGFHQPQNSPHWVETGNSRSISFTFVIETEATKAKMRTRCFNHYLRKLRFSPVAPGIHPAVDIFKAETMRVVLPARKNVGRVINKFCHGATAG